MALGHAPDVVAKNPNLMAQEMLRDIARIAQKQAKEMIAAQRKNGGAASEVELEPGQVINQLLQPNMLIPNLTLQLQKNQQLDTGSPSDGKDSLAKNAQVKEKLRATLKVEPVKKEEVPTMKLPTTPVKYSEEEGPVELTTRGNTTPPAPEETSVRKPRKGTPVKLCPVTTAAGLDLSCVKRQVVFSAEDGSVTGQVGYHEDSDQVSAEGKEEQNESPQNIGMLKVPIRRPRESPRPRIVSSAPEQTEGLCMVRSPQREEVHKEVPTTESGNTKSNGLLDLTGSGRMSVTGTQDLLEAVSQSDPDTTMARKQILVLNGREYEIVPVGAERWITRNEYELLRELCMVEEGAKKNITMQISKAPEAPWPIRKSPITVASGGGIITSNGHTTPPRDLQGKAAEINLYKKRKLDNEVENIKRFKGESYHEVHTSSHAVLMKPEVIACETQSEEIVVVPSVPMDTCSDRDDNVDDETSGLQIDESPDVGKEVDINCNSAEGEENVMPVGGVSVKKVFPVLKQLLNPPQVWAS